MRPIYLIVGVPCSGKSLICQKVSEYFEYIPHDFFIEYKKDHNKMYVEKIRERSCKGEMPILAETPFSISQIADPLVMNGHDVVPLFIFEDEEIIKSRYLEREEKEIPQGHLTRMKTYRKRADSMKAFQGDGDTVLKRLILIGEHWKKDREQ